MPAITRGAVSPQAADNPAAQYTPPAPTPDDGPLDRSALVNWLTAQAANAEPDPNSAEQSAGSSPAPEPDQVEPNPEAQAPDQPEPEPQAEQSDLSHPNDDDGLPEPAESPEDPGAAADRPGVQKRINKMRRELGDAQREIERLHEQLATAREKTRDAATAVPTAPAIGSLHAKQGALASERTQIESALDQIEQNPEGITIGEQSWDAAALRQERRRLTTRLYSIEQEQREFERSMEHSARNIQVEAEKVHPWLKDKTHPDTLLIEQFAADWPGLSKVPGFKAILADAITFRRGQARKAQPTAPRPAPKAPPATTAAPPPPETRQARVTAAVDRMRKEGSRDSLIEYIQAQQG